MTTTTPTPEQVAASKLRLTTYVDGTPEEFSENESELLTLLDDDIRTILSALSTAEEALKVEKILHRDVFEDRGRIHFRAEKAESEIQQCRETLRLKPSESLPAGVSRLALQVESVEADSKRLAILNAAIEDDRLFVDGCTLPPVSAYPPDEDKEGE